MLPDENCHLPEQIKQSILEGAQVGGDVNIRDITQITINQPEPPKAVGIPQNIPYRGVTKFVGRTAEMELLHQMLQGTECVAIYAIAGMGGVGKTELAIQYTRTYQKSYQGGICWLQAQKQSMGYQILIFAKVQLGLALPIHLEVLLQKLQEVQLGLKSPENRKNLEEEEDLLRQVHQNVHWCWQHWQQEGDVLVVFDDVKDYTEIQPYLPRIASRFRVLLTTRRKLLTTLERLELNVLSLDAALALLEWLIDKERVQRELESAKSLCQELGCLPLGLELVGRYLTRKKYLSLAEMLRLLREKGLEQQALKKPNSESDMTAQLGVAAAFDLSWQELTPDAQELACFLSIFDLVAISWQIVEQCFPEQYPEELEEIRDYVLLDLHLIQEENHGKYKLHELIRYFLQNKLLELDKTNDIKKYISIILAKSVENNPCCIIEILKQKLLDWNFTDDVLQIPAVEFGWQLRNATQAWVKSLGQLANLVFHLRKDGTIPTLGVRIVSLSITNPVTKVTYGYDNYLQTGWYFGNSDLEDIVEFPPEAEKIFADINKGRTPEAEQLFADGWNYFKRAQLKPQASWAWQWTLNLIRDSLSELLKQRKIPINPGLLSLEAAWYAALHLTNRRNYSYYKPLPLNEIEKLLSQVNNSHFSPMMQHCVNQLRLEIEHLRGKGETNFSLPSSFENLKNSQYISPEILLKYTADVFQGAIEGYLQIVNSWFQKFIPNLQLASIFPARLVGVVVPSPYTASVTWFWEPLLTGSQSFVEFKLSENPISQNDTRFQFALNQIRSLRPNSFKYPSIKIQSQSPLSNSWLGSNPITELVYKWLWEDLKKIFLLEGELSNAGFPYWR